MSLTLTSFSDGTPISATDINARIASTELYINEEIASGDLQTSTPWVGSTHLYPPDFFGSPHPRVEATCFDVYHRAVQTPVVGRDYNWTIFHNETAADVFRPVPGLCTPVRVESNSTWVTVIASFYAFAQASEASATLASDVDEGTLAATFALYVGGAAVTGSERKVYSNLAQQFPRKQLSMVYASTLDAGVHNVGVRIKVDGTNVNSNTAASIYIQPRNLIVIIDPL